MTPDEAPVGTIVTIGHPANGKVAQKVEFKWPTTRTAWVYLEPSGAEVDLDDLWKTATMINLEQA